MKQLLAFIRRRPAGWPVLIGFALVIFGAKLWLIDFGSSDLPVLDQWDGEEATLLRPWAEGRLGFHDLIHPHNEHRIVTTKLYVLALTAVNGQWDGLVEAAGSAAVHAACALLLLLLARRWLGSASLAAFGLLLLALFSLPFSWENTISGFQVQFYFLIIFSLLHLALTLESDRSSWRWAGGQICAALALGSIASGFFSSIAILAVLGWRLVRERRWTAQQVVTAALSLALVIAGALLVNPVPAHARLHAHSLGEFSISLLRSLAWPGVATLPWAVLPATWFSLRLVRRRTFTADDAILLGWLSWDFLQCVALAYGRASGDTPASRYLDLLALNVALSFILIAREFRGRFRRLALVVWLVVAVVTLAGVSRHQFRYGVAPLAPFRDRQEARVRDYIRTGDPHLLEGRWPAIPYPDSNALRDHLDQPAIRRLLSPGIRSPVPVRSTTPWKVPAELPPSPEPVAFSTWSAGGSGVVVWRSAPQSASALPVLRFYVAGDLGAAGHPLHLVVKSAAGTVPVVPELAPGSRWKTVNVFRPRGAWWIEAEDADPAGWFAFTEPVEVGRLSWLVGKLLKHHLAILVAGAVILLAGATWWSGVKVRALRFPSGMRPAFFAIVSVFLLGGAIASILLDHFDAFARFRASISQTRVSVTTDPGLAAFAGAVPGPVAGDRSWLGTYAPNDSFRGDVPSPSFVLHTAVLQIPLLGYPAAHGNALDLDILSPDGSVVSTITYQGDSPHETPGSWQVRVDEWVGRRARLVLHDRSVVLQGWLAVGTVSFSATSGIPWLYGVPRNYVWFVIAAVALAGLLFLPGLALRTWPPARWPPLATVLLPVPGLLLLAGFGLFVWITHTHVSRAVAPVWLALHAATALALGVRWWRNGPPFSQRDFAALGVYGCVVTGALAFGVIPLTVVQEYTPHSSSQARMVASPPDNTIPYRTAAYFFHHKNGREDRRSYFGDDWSAASRGPLSALAIAGTFTLFGQTPADPPGSRLDAWPASSDCFYLARIVGILADALVVLGGAALAGALAGSAARRLALCWLAVSPVVIINTDFVWPKLLASFFVCLAAIDAFAARPPWRVAIWTALACLCHPVGGLFAPVLLIVVAQRHVPRAGLGLFARLRSATRPGGAYVLTLFGCLAPWFAFKLWVGFPDRFLHYVLGDGRGFASAAGFGSWLMCRLDNLWFTLTPGAFYFSHHMQTWLEGPLSQPARWALGYAKSLPGATGLALFLVAAVVVLRRPATVTLATFRRWLLAGAGLIMLVFWGFSSDGLGRNCLEPLAVLLIAYVAAVCPRHWRFIPWLVVVVAIESLSVRAIGVLTGPDFTTAQIGDESVVLAVIVTIGTLAPALLFLARPGQQVQPSAKSSRDS